MNRVLSTAPLPWVSGSAALLVMWATGSACQSEAEDRPQDGGNNDLSNMGGSSWNGGSSGAGGGSGGNGFGGATAFEYPSCLRELFALCGTDGACTDQRSDAGLPSQLCYASGARAAFTEQAVCGPFEITVTKPNGELCFTYVVSDVSPSQACENGNLAWTNAAGETVATGHFSYGTGPQETITCTASGVSSSCSTPCTPRGWPVGSMSCSQGSCP